MMSEKWVLLLKSIIKLTNDGLLKWEETSDEDAFQTQVGEVTVEVELRPQFLEYSVRIIGADGRTVDHFGASDINNLTGSSWFEDVEHLIDSIRRRLSGADEVLDKLLKSLSEKEDEIPF